MTERLKGTSRVCYHINIGNYQHLEVEATREFWADEADSTNELAQLEKEVLDWMDKRGIRPTILVKPVERKT